MRYCERAARHLAAHIGFATTLNEPNIMSLLKWFGLPSAMWDAQRAMLAPVNARVPATRKTEWKSAGTGREPKAGASRRPRPGPHAPR